MKNTITAGSIHFTLLSLLRTSHGYTYLPEEHVELAMERLASRYENLYCAVKHSRGGICKLVVGRLTAKTMRQLYAVYIR